MDIDVGKVVPEPKDAKSKHWWQEIRSTANKHWDTSRIQTVPPSVHLPHGRSGTLDWGNVIKFC